MGQYFYIMNLDKKEYLHPHKIGCGLKLWEICANDAISCLPFLLRQSNEGGGGDYNMADETSYCGRWAGDRIAVIGDYDASKLYQEAYEGNGWKEISVELAKEYNPWIELEEKKIGEW